MISINSISLAGRQAGRCFPWTPNPAIALEQPLGPSHFGRVRPLSLDLHGLQTMPPEHVIAHAFAPLRRFYASSLCALVLIYYGLDSSIELSWVQQDLGHQHIYQGW
jgi:hypothetical protein